MIFLITYTKAYTVAKECVLSDASFSKWGSDGKCIWKMEWILSLILQNYNTYHYIKCFEESLSKEAI